MNILITSPSLDENKNVSGISSLVKDIISQKTENVFYHLKLGKTDMQKKTNFAWYVNQLLLIPGVFFRFLKHPIDLVHLNTGLERASVIRDFVVFVVAKFIFRKKVLFHMHGGYYLMQPPPPRSIYFKLINCIVKNAELTLVLSELEKTHVDQTYQIQSRVLVNAVDIPLYIDDKKTFSKPLTLFFLGRIVKSKGIFVILNCLKKLKDFYPDFHFDVYGSGLEADSFLDELKTIEGLSHKYHGVIAGKNKWEAMKNSHIFLLPSINSEGLPVAMLEAMAAGCIAMVSDDASMSAVIADGENGYIVKRNDEEALFEKLKYIFEHVDQLPAISNRAHNLIVEKHSMASYIKNLDIYYNLCFSS